MVQFTAQNLQICYSFTHVHNTPMQDFYGYFPECRFCACCGLLQWVRTESGYQVHQATKYISCIFESKIFIIGAFRVRE